MLLAFHADPRIKVKYLARVIAHRQADEIVQGAYWVHGKGCAVGCTLHSSNHLAYETELGVPLRLAYLEDQLFELMTLADAKPWPEQFLAAIPVSADLSQVWARFVVWLLTDPEHGVLRHVEIDTGKAVIRRVAELWREGGSGGDFYLAQYRARTVSDELAAIPVRAAYNAAASFTDARFVSRTVYDAADSYVDGLSIAARYGLPWEQLRSRWALVAATKLLALLREA